MKRTELLWEEGRIRGRENNSILNEYALINYVLESVYQYSLPVACLLYTSDAADDPEIV